MQTGRILCTVFVTALAAGCADSRPATSPLAPADARFAKGASSGDLVATFVLPNSGGYALLGDGKYLDASGQSTYADAVCGVHAVIFTGNGGGDATMQTNNAKFADRKCRDYPRKVWVGGETNALVEVMLYVARLDQPGAEIPIGGQEDRPVSINPASGSCGRYSFDGASGSDLATVTRIDAKTWLVQSKPAPNNRARCVSDGTGPYALDISFTVIAQ